MKSSSHKKMYTVIWAVIYIEIKYSLVMIDNWNTDYLEVFYLYIFTPELENTERTDHICNL